MSPVATHPPHRGNRQRILQIAGLFQENGFDIELAIGRDRQITNEAKEFWPVIHRLKNSPKWKPTSRTVPFDSWYATGLGEEVANIVEERTIDVVLLNYIFHSKLLDLLPKKVVKIIDTHDVFTNRRELYVGYRYTGGFFSCTDTDEEKYLRRADIVLSISPEDSEKFTKRAPSVRVVDIPFLAHRDGWSPGRNPRPLPTGKRIIGIVLSANDLNVASLHSFIAAVDDIYGRTPPFTVEVAGDIYSKSLRWFPHRRVAFSRPWLRFLGEVPDIHRFYDEVDLIAVPVIAGSGMAIKFSDAILSDTPVLSTAAGSRGHSVTHDFHNHENNWDLVKNLGAVDQNASQHLRDAELAYHAAATGAVQAGWAQLNHLLSATTTIEPPEKPK